MTSTTGILVTVQSGGAGVNMRGYASIIRRANPVQAMYTEKRREMKMEEKKSFSWENGDVAELADGERAIYLNGISYCYNGEDKETGFLDMSNYDKDLKNYWTTQFNITKVWRYPDTYCTDELISRIKDEHLKNAKIVFDAPVKMTLAEVCEVLGKNIMIVKED